MKHFSRKTASSELRINYRDTGNNVVWVEHAALCGCKSYWINNINSIIPFLQEVSACFLSSLSVFHDKRYQGNIVMIVRWVSLVDQPRAEAARNEADAFFFFPPLRTRTVFKWKPQAVQTRWQCKWAAANDWFSSCLGFDQK